MEKQKKQRHNIAEIFQLHLEKVKELIQTSLQNIPDDLSFDSKTLVKTELLQFSSQQEDVNIKSEPCDQLDRMMCDIVDSMTTDMK
jgi:mediator of RNA polymerase II transcription subunit 7